MKIFLQFALLLVNTALAVTYGSRDSSLDPGRITWWKEAWSQGPIVASSNHAGAVTLTFNFRLQTALASTGVVQISDATLLTGPYEFTGVRAAATDLSATTAAQTVVTQVYGPFKIVTRACSACQIIDANFAFGSIFISAAISADTTGLTVLDSATVATSTYALKATIGLSFSFSLTTDLWERDSIVIESINALITVPASPTCNFVNTGTSTAVVNNLCPTTTVDTCSIACEKSDSKIVIYGLNKFVNYKSTSLPVKITIAGFTLPAAVHSGSEFSWAVYLRRFGTNTELFRWTATGPSTLTTITPGSISCTATPYRFTSVKLVSGLSLYMQYSCTTSNTIPISGKIEIAFANIVAANFDDTASLDCTAGAYLCSVTTSKPTITFSAAEVAAGAFTFIVQNTLAASSNSYKVTSYKSTGQKIDESADIAITLSAATDLIGGTFSVFGHLAGGATGPASGTDNLSGGGPYIYFDLAVTPTLAAIAAGTFLYQCPLVTDAVSITSLYIGTGVTHKYVTSATPSQDYSLMAAQTATVATNSVTFTNTAAVTAAHKYIVATNSAANPSTVRLPQAARNKFTYYHCYAQITTATNTYTSKGAFSVVAQKWIGAGPFIQRDAGSMPLYIKLTAITYPTLATWAIKLSAAASGFQTGVNSITLTGYIATGIAAATSTISGKIENTVLTVTGFGALASSSDSMIVLPLGAPSSTAAAVLTGNIILYATDSNARQLNLASGAITETMTATGALTGGSATAGTHPAVGGSYTITVTGGYTEVGTGTKFIVVSNIPKGWDITNAGFTHATVTAEIWKLSSTDPTFTAQSIIYKLSATPQAAGYSITGIKPAYVLTTGTALINYQETGKDPDVVGKFTIGATWTVTAGTLSASVTPSGTSLPGKGPGALNQNVVVSFTALNAIPIDGKVVVILSSFWTLGAGATCTATGLEHKTANTALSCAIVGVTATITNLKAVTANTAVTVTLTKAYPSSQAATPSSGVKCVASVTTKTLGDETIDAVTNVSSCENLVNSVVGKSTFGTNAARLYPNSAGRRADIGLTFSLSQAVPSGSIIVVNSPLAVTLGTDSCFASFAFSTCTATGSTISFTTSADLAASASLEILVDNAVTVGSAAGTGLFNVKSTWESITITDDTIATITTTSVTYGVAGAEISNGAVTMTVKNPGEYSSYTFAYTPTVAIDATDLIWISFPHNYDPNIGITMEETAGVNYLQCTSTNFSSIRCKADHWKVVISGLSSVVINTAVSIVIKNVLNPMAATGLNFGFVHLDSTATTVKAADDTFSATTVAIADSPASLSLRSVSNSSSKELSAKSDYVFKFYVDFTIMTADAIFATFPGQYLLDVANGSSVSCSAKFYDESTTTETTNDVVASVSTCSIVKNSAYYTAPTLTAGVDLDTHDRVELTLSSVENARWGFSRSENGVGIVFYDVDSVAIANSVFTSYSYWSTKFDVSIWDSSATSVVNRSYQNQNSGYVSFADASTLRVALSVDNWSGMTQVTRIIVIEGSQTSWQKVRFANGKPLIADSLTLSYSFTSSGTTVTLWTEDDWTYYILDEYINFRVSAPANAAVGYQYLTWAISSEVKEGCRTTAIYGAGPRVLVEVQDTTSAVSITTALTAYNGATSHPVAVTLVYPPATDLSVNIVFTGNTLKVNATSVVFGAGQTVGYFYFLVTDATSGAYTGTLSLSGTNAASYTIAASLTVTVVAQPATTSTINEVVVTESAVGSNSAVITVTGGADGTAYISLKCSQTSTGFIQYHTLEDFKEHVSEAGDMVYEPEWEDVYYNSTSEIEFYQYLKDIYQMECYTERFWAVSHVSLSSSVTATWLNDGTYYNAKAFVENPLSVSKNNTKTFTTSSSKTLKKLAVTVTSLTNVTITEENVDKIACQLAIDLSVPTYYLHYNGFTSKNDATNNLLFISEYSWNVLYYRASSAMDPATFVAGLDVSGTATEIKTALALTATTDVVAIAAAADVAAVSAPAIGSSLPEQSDTVDGGIEFTWTPDSSGEWCVTCVHSDEDDAELTPLPNQIAHGLSAYSNEAGYLCVSVTAAVESVLTVEDLEELEDYYCYHAICSTNHLLPSCTAVVVDNEAFETDNASLLALFGFALALIFN